MKILQHSNDVSLWHEMIQEGEKICHVVLEEELESYLVFLMIRYITKPEIANQIMASEFLKGLQLASNHRQQVLQGVGDKCLLLTGLFPYRSEKRLVKISYFVNLGQSSYANISHTNNDLYSLLSKQFVTLMDILQSLRQYTQTNPDLLPLQAYELWNETGSQRAFSLLKQYSNAIPMSTPLSEK